MSYNKRLTKLVDFVKITDNYSSRGGAKIKYIVIHYVGQAGSTAKNNLDYFARVQVPASAHFFVDRSYIGQSVPLDMAAWHCGGGLQDYGRKWTCGNQGATKHGKCSNANSIGIELCCVKSGGKIVPDPRAIKRARKLVMLLMEIYGIDAYHVIRHFDVTGKCCPNGYINAYRWRKLRHYLTGITDIPPWRAQYARRRVVTCNKLTVRSGSNSRYRKVGTLHKGDKIYVYKTYRGWGRISKKYPKWVPLRRYTKPRKY